MSADIKIVPTHPTASKISLMDLLKAKTYGSRITAAEICECTGSDDWRRFGDIIRKWAADAGLPLQAVTNDGWRICNANEVVNSADTDRRSALRKERKGLRKLLNVPAPQLTDAEQRRLEFQMRHTAVRVARAEEDDKETRRQFKVADRVPLLRGVSIEDGKKSTP